MEPTQEAVQHVTPVEPAGSTEEAAQKLDALLGESPPEDETPPEEPEAQEETPEKTPEETPEETPEPEEADNVVTHFAELADHLGVEDEFLDSLIVPTKVNGVESTTTFKDLVASYQKGESADQKFMELAENRKAFDAELNKTKEALQQEWSRAQALNSELQRMLSGSEDESLQELRYSDPGEYAARMAERQQKIQKATEMQSQLQQENAAKLNDQYSQRINIEKQKLLQALPAWADEKTMERENAEVRGYLKSQGLDDSEIDGRFDSQGNLLAPGIIDHRAIVMARKAMLYDSAQKQTEPKKKRLKSLPKVGSGKPRGKGEVKTAKQNAIRERARSSGSVDDAALIIQQIMEG